MRPIFVSFGAKHANTPYPQVWLLHILISPCHLSPSSLLIFYFNGFESLRCTRALTRSTHQHHHHHTPPILCGSICLAFYHILCVPITLDNVNTDWKQCTPCGTIQSTATATDIVLPNIVNRHTDVIDSGFLLYSATRRTKKKNAKLKIRPIFAGRSMTSQGAVWFCCQM